MIPDLRQRESTIKTWMMRIIGLWNILFAIFALLFEAAAALISGGRFPTKVTPTPMDWVVFILLLALSNYLVVHPALYGVRLIRRIESAILPSALFFAAQTFVFALFVYILLHWRSKLEIVSGLWVFALLPIQYSVSFGFSTIGLVATIILLFLSRRDAIERARENATAIQGAL